VDILLDKEQQEVQAVQQHMLAALAAVAEAVA
jgi:hypothetical protein